ncbi:hypothetical protein CLOM_g9295 [Closterium sp. NIES-68]|nr:hypothetical protein CLOM_g9295 [Closterium sp. NIES-68]GJP79930.1 hypothetical protein CLOP_g10144 [Closterium sp. NIES-67]
MSQVGARVRGTAAVSSGFLVTKHSGGGGRKGFRLPAWASQISSSFAGARLVSSSKLHPLLSHSPVGRGGWHKRGRAYSHRHRSVAEVAGTEGGVMERSVGRSPSNGSVRSSSSSSARIPEYDLSLVSGPLCPEQPQSSAEAAPSTTRSQSQQDAWRIGNASNGAVRADATNEDKVLGAGESTGTLALDEEEAADGGLWREVSEGDLQQVLASLEDRFIAEPGASLDTIEANARVLFAVGARRGQVLRIFRAQPELAGREYGAAVRDKAELLAAFRIAPAAFLKALSRSLDWLATPATHAATVLTFLDRDLGINNLARVVAVCPDVLSQPIDRLSDTVTFLRTDLSLGAEVGAALERNPALLGAGNGGGRADVVRKLEALRSLLRLDRSVDVLPLVQRSPPLLSASADVARDTYKQLSAVLGEEGAAAVALARPQILALSETAVRETLTQIARRFGGAGPAASVLASANPSLLRRRWDRTAGKLEYVTEVMGRDIAEIAAWPAVLSCNLQTRIKRRYDALQAAGLGAKEPLRVLFGCSDRVFERRFDVVLPKPTKGKRGRKPKT